MNVWDNQVVVNGAGSEVGKAAIVAIHKARGMQLAGAVDSIFQGNDAGEVMLLLSAILLHTMNCQCLAVTNVP